ncbi:methyl-accepting chemotaxis protein [Sulfurimonas sp.]|uniref:methyl-accepting chemotaxis protein n=1 Tax=Sulfurimonas sp. TaxID=2022749 RepID=UPI0026069BF6|nr:methyl-accepting chemotaxis protein [Sulfurimonas sp.]MDD5156512.1 methyl-accepting chemotaxis protein [Sulfurimonas sp.]
MNWLENMILRSKLILLTTVMMSAIIVLGYLGYNSTLQWQASMNDIGAIRMPSIVGVMDMRSGINQVVIQQNRIISLEGDSKQKEQLQDALDKIIKGFERYDKGAALYAPLPQTPEEATEWKKYEENYTKWKDLSVNFRTNIFIPLINNTDPALEHGYFVQMREFIAKSRESRQAAFNSMDVIAKINIDGGNQAVKDATIKSANAAQLSIVIVLVALILSLILSMLIIRSITRAITSSVGSIRDGAMQITSASDQVASSSSSLAQGASQQASSVEEVSATLEQSTAINSQNTDNARQADILAKNANDSARAGYEKGEQLSHSMHAITQSAAKISGIIKTIDQIAFQTNLLALNAAVEAARAGEHGLGFAVVADEVRNLAQRAASAAKETSDIIEEVVGQIKEGNQIALATHTSFQEIVEQSKKVSDLIGEISISGKEQSEGMAQINQAMGQVDQVTQQVAANSEEAAAAAEELNAQATAMMETVGVLAKMIGMETGAAASAPKKKQLHSLEIKTLPPMRKPVKMAQSGGVSSSRSEDVFPLHEDDLKEF